MTLTKNLLPLCLICLLFLSSCLQKAYFQSPLMGAVAAYHPAPVASDSLKAASYLNAAINLGGMNENMRDNVFGFQAGLHRAHVINHIRLFYGAGLSLGTYNIKPYDYYYYTDTASINRHAGTKFAGAYGGYGGISLATPMGRRGEWRYLGLEGGLYNEFGSYSSFRKNLPDSAATTIDKKGYLGSLAVTTEWVFKRRSQNKFGMKFSFGSYLRRLDYYDKNPNTYYHPHDNLLFFSAAYQGTIRKSTGFVQLNFTNHAANFQFGFSRRL